MPLLKRRPTLANWLLVAAFLGVVFFLYQNLFTILGNALGLLIVSLYALIYLLPFFLISLGVVGTIILALVPVVLLLVGLILFRRRRRKRLAASIYTHYPAAP